MMLPANTVLTRLQVNIICILLPSGCEALIARVFPMGNLVQGINKKLGHPGLVQGYLPGKHRSMISVTSNHITRCIENMCMKFQAIAVILPSQYGINAHDSQFIAGVHKSI